VQEKRQEYQRVHSCGKDHGRLESRTLETSTSLVGYLDWPGVQQVLRRHTRRTLLKTGQTSEKTTYAITSLSRSQADAHTLAALWRAHWSIDDRVHYVRDVAFREDAGHVHTGHAPHTLAALRNAILNCLRHQGWRSIPDAFAYDAASLHRSLTLIGAHAPP
jgi:predicted transposase YbfD/YdcC